MRILNFDDFSLCYSTKKETFRQATQVWTPQCSLRQGVWTHRCGLHRGLHNIFFSQELTGVGYTGVSGLNGVGYTSKSRLPGAAYTGESLVPPSRPANALKGTIPEKADCEC